MIAYASSLDCVGIMAKEVSDVRTTMGELFGSLACARSLISLSNRCSLRLRREGSDLCASRRSGSDSGAR